MTVNESRRRKRRYSSSSLNTIKTNLFVTPKKTVERMSVLNDGSKSVNYISKMDYKISNLLDITKETDYNSKFNSKFNETFIDNLSKGFEKVEKSLNESIKTNESNSSDKVDTSSSNEIAIKLTTPQKSNITLINSKLENSKNSIFDMEIKSLTPNKPTINIDDYKEYVFNNDVDKFLLNPHVKFLCGLNSRLTSLNFSFVLLDS